MDKTKVLTGDNKITYCQNCFKSFKSIDLQVLFQSEKASILVCKQCLYLEKVKCSVRQNTIMPKRASRNSQTTKLLRFPTVKVSNQSLSSTGTAKTTRSCFKSPVSPQFKLGSKLQKKSGFLSPVPKDRNSKSSTFLSPTQKLRRFVFSEEQPRKHKKKPKVKLLENKVKKAVQLINNLKEVNINDLDFNIFKSMISANKNKVIKRPLVPETEGDETLDASQGDTEGDKKNELLCNCASNKEMTIVCLTDKVGCCADCVYEHMMQNHELVTIHDTIREVNTVLQNVESNTVDVLKQKVKMLKACEDHANFINYDKDQFLETQRQKINELHKYLEQKYSNIVVEYNKAIERDLLNIKNNSNRISREIEENQSYLAELKKVQTRFEDLEDYKSSTATSKTNMRVNYLLKAMKFFKTYKNLKQKNDKVVDFKAVFQAEVLTQKPKLSVEYEEYIDDICKLVKDVPTAKPSFEAEGNVIKEIVKDDYDSTKPRLSGMLPNKFNASFYKIRIPRWCTKQIAEYEIEHNFWMSTEAKTDTIFYPFSSFVYLSTKEILVIGGLNDCVKTQTHMKSIKSTQGSDSEDDSNQLKTFSSKVLKITERSINFLESRYETTELQPMRTKRGCMTSCATPDNKVFVCGGLYHEDIVLKKCEVYDMKTDVWEPIKSMNIKRKNASSTYTKSGHLYVFGGSLPEENETETIERYTRNSSDDLGTWEILPIKIYDFLSSQIIFKTSSRTILLLGGSVLDSNGRYERSDRVYRLFTDTNWLQEEKPLSKPVHSLYPGFINGTNMMIIDEDHKMDQPTVVIYSIAMFLPGVSAEEAN